MALDGENEDLSLATDGASDAVSQHDEPVTVASTVREAFNQAKEVAEAGDDPEKLEAIRVRRAKDGRFERGEENDTRDATGQPQKAPKAKEPPSSENKEAPAQEAPVKTDANAPLALRPPPGWNAQARADYPNLPLHFKQAVAQRELEVNKGLAMLAEYKGIETHLPRIKASNLTPAQFVNNAVAWEDSLKRDPMGTLVHAARQGGVNLVQFANMVLQRSGQRPQQGQPQARQAAPQQQFNPQQLVEQAFTRREQEQASKRAETEAETFLSDPKNVHAEAVVDDMVALIKAAKDQGKQLPLKDAYEMACWAKPDIRAELIKQQRAQPSNGNPRRTVVQARSAAKATVGAPSGLPPARQATALPKTARDAVRLAYAQAMDAE